MCLATHPFLRDVAATTSPLLALQGSVTLTGVNRCWEVGCGVAIRYVSVPVIWHTWSVIMSSLVTDQV